MLQVQIPCFHYAGSSLISPRSLKYAVWAALIILVEPASYAQSNQSVNFSSGFLQLSNPQSVDLSRYNNGASIPAGTYSVRLTVNGASLGNQDIELRERDDNSLYPCLSDKLLRQFPFREDRLPAHFFEQAAQCADIAQLLPETTTHVDSNEMLLAVQIPQLYIATQPRGTVNPALWDSGIPVAILSYTLNGYQNSSQQYDQRSLYAGLNAGLNIGAWYLRQNGSYNWDQHGDHAYSVINSYLERDVPPLHARVLAGQANTRGDIFDTLPFTGVQLATDERMLPDSQRGYAPEIHGIARTHAKVTIRQSGAIIYQTSVSPGAFLIDDLYPTGYGGDLIVTVEEADGHSESFTVPYAPAVEQLRPGSTRFEIVGGTLRNDFLSDHIALYQGTMRHGLTNSLTGYSGFQLSQGYYAVLGGIALGTGIGSFALDITQSGVRLENSHNQDTQGQSYRFSYSKTISETQSSLALAAYRFSSAGFADFMTAQEMLASSSRLQPASSRQRYSVTASQGVGQNGGQLFLSASLEDYWNTSGTNEQYQLGYNNTFGSISFGLSAGRTYSIEGAEETFLFTLSAPLGHSDSSYRPQLSMQLAHDTTGHSSEQATLSGSAGVENQFSYSATATNSNQGSGSSGALSAQYRSLYSNISAGWSGGHHYSSGSLGANGTVVLHSGGVTFSPYISETFALVEAKGATGASVSGYQGVHVDSRGYALVPYLDPYQLNDISLDPKGASEDVEMSSTEKKVAPYYGAVVKVSYGAKRGIPILINASLDHQMPVPFASEVLDEKGRNVGSVGQGGLVYARVEADQGVLTVRWGKGQAEACHVSYHLMPYNPRSTNTLQTFDTHCSL